MPRLGKLFVEREVVRLRRLVLLFALLGGTFGGIGVLAVGLAGQWILAPLYGSEYAAHAELLFWLMAAASILYAVRFVADALTAMRCVRVHLTVQALAAAVVLVGGILAIPARGMIGMAQVLMLAFALRGVILLGCFWWQTSRLAVPASDIDRPLPSR